jgi:hypothetical protein
MKSLEPSIKTGHVAGDQHFTNLQGGKVKEQSCENSQNTKS